MKSKRAMWSVVVCAVAVVIASCAQSPADRWFQARANLSGAQDATVIANQAGWISDDEFVNVVAPTAHTARGYLDESFKLLPEGGEFFDHLMLLLDQAVIELQRRAVQPKGT